MEIGKGKNGFKLCLLVLAAALAIGLAVAFGVTDKNTATGAAEAASTQRTYVSLDAAGSFIKSWRLYDIPDCLYPTNTYEDVLKCIEVSYTKRTSPIEKRGMLNELINSLVFELEGHYFRDRLPLGDSEFKVYMDEDPKSYVTVKLENVCEPVPSAISIWSPPVSSHLLCA